MPRLRVPLMVMTLFLCAVSATTAEVIVFNTDFESGIPSGKSGTGSLAGVQGYSGLGLGADVFAGNFLRTEAGNGVANGITLSLSGLPTHSSIDIDFLLAVIDSWDGVGDRHHGPDGFAVSVDGMTIFSTVFQNSGSGTQTYVPPAGVQLARHANLGFAVPGPSNFFRDSAYNMGLDPTFSSIAHTSSSLTVSWFRNSGLQINSPTFVDESYAIDNLRISLNGTSAAVPEPSSVASLTLLAVLAFAFRKRREVSKGS